MKKVLGLLLLALLAACTAVLGLEFLGVPNIEDGIGVRLAHQVVAGESPTG